MRKNLVTIAFLFLVINYASAQSTRFGIIGGATYATMIEKYPERTLEEDAVSFLGDFRFGGTFGVMLDVPMEKNGSFRTGVNLLQKGTKDLNPAGDEDVKLTRRLNYAEVPLMILFNIPSKAGKIRLGGGPAAAFALSGKQKVQIGGNENEEDIDFGDKTDSDMNWVDFGINLQGEYEFSNGVFIAANYNHGINRLFVGGSDDIKLYNRYFGLRVGYFFGKKK